MKRLIRRTIQQWLSWRARKAMNKAYPQLAKLQRDLAEHRKHHRRGSAKIVKAKMAVVNAALAGRR